MRQPTSFAAEFLTTCLRVSDVLVKKGRFKQGLQVNLLNHILWGWYLRFKQDSGGFYTLKSENLTLNFKYLHTHTIKTALSEVLSIISHHSQTLTVISREMHAFHNLGSSVRDFAKNCSLDNSFFFKF